jgi:integrase
VRTLGELATLYLQRHATGWRPSSRAAQAKRWRRLYRTIQPLFPLAKLDTDAVQRVVSDLAAAGLSPLTVRNVIGSLTAALAWGVAEGHLDRAPTAGLALPEVVEMHRDVLSDADVARLLTAAEAMGRDALLLVALPVLAGLRAGEVLATQWGDVDLTGRVLRVRNRASFTTKNGRVRSIPISDRLLAILDAHHADAGYLVHPEKQPRPNRRRWDFRRTFRTALAQAGVDPLPYHSLRRTFATRAAEKGVPLSKIRVWLGHHSLAVTQRYIQHGDGFDTDIDKATAG